VLRSRPDFRAADLLVKAARNAVREAWMDYLPTLTVTGTYRFTQNTGWSGEYDSWNIVLSLEWVLFDGGLRRATVLEKNSQLRETRLQRRLARRTIGREVRQARRDMSTSLATHKIARQKLKLARKNRDMVIRRYRAGLGTYLDLVDTEDELKKAEVEFVAEELNLALKKLELLRVLGFDPRGRKLPKR
jgi:outer membrane protein TolC